MQTGKQEIGALILSAAFILGGILGIGIWPALIPVCMIILMKSGRNRTLESKGRGFYPVDYCIVGICVAEILSCIFSVNIHNSIKASTPIITLSFFWFFFRAMPGDKKTGHLLITRGSILALIFSFITIGTFIHFKTEFSTYETSITNFKQEYTPMGMPVNDWVAFLLSLLPYPLMSAIGTEDRPKRLFHIAVSALLTASVILSLSRGAYVALVVFYLLSIIFAISNKSGNKCVIIRIIVLSAFLGLTVVMPASKEVLTTCAMSKTTSQKLSTQGRMQLVEDCLSIWKDKPVTGVGAGNFNIVYDSRVVDRKASSTRATNTYALILVEKGILGLIAYCGLIIVLLVSGLKGINKGPSQYLFLACFVALCVRGLFFSSLFDRRAVLMMVMLVIYGLAQENQGDEAVE